MTSVQTHLTTIYCTNANHMKASSFERFQTKSQRNKSKDMCARKAIWTARYPLRYTEGSILPPALSAFPSKIPSFSIQELQSGGIYIVDMTPPSIHLDPIAKAEEKHKEDLEEAKG